MKITKENREWLKRNVPNAESLMEGAVVTPLLDVLYDVIDEKGFDYEGDYNAFGLKAQEVYDDLYEFA